MDVFICIYVYICNYKCGCVCMYIYIIFKTQKEMTVQPYRPAQIKKKNVSIIEIWLS